VPSNAIVVIESRTVEFADHHPARASALSDRLAEAIRFGLNKSITGYGWLLCIQILDRKAILV
jgi:hypothetical protein